MSTRENNDYWKTKRGSDYAAQQALRRSYPGIHSEYRVQERWISGFLRAFAQRIGRAPRVLEVGCGFGRFFPVVQDAGGVYHGYDFSEAMAAPILQRDEARGCIKVAPTLLEAWPGEDFDVVFTVSVLIHNELPAAQALVAAMRQLLRPEGVIVCIENRVVLRETEANSWHGGCWAHDVARDLAPDMDVCIREGVLDGQAIYLLSEAGQQRTVRVSGTDRHGSVTLAQLSTVAASRVQQLEMAREVETGSVRTALARLYDMDEAFDRLRGLLAMLGVAHALDMGPAEVFMELKSRLKGEGEDRKNGHSRND